MENKYWNHTGELQAQYDEMLAAKEAGTFKFTQVCGRLTYSYYRYYNDGDMPGWARGRWDITRTTYKYGSPQKELTEDGEAEFERRVTRQLEIEWRRYTKAHKPA